MIVNSILKKHFVLPVTCISLLWLISCAKQGTILGGPKDETPPRVVKTKPAENTVNFEPRKKIVITFDEYIETPNVYQELILSPPIEGNVITQIQGKNLTVQFPSDVVFDTLTYTIDFGNSIVDVNEKNVLKNFRYVFSLKDYIDSMNVEGVAVSAFDHKPNTERLFVMLYRNLNDSAPYLEKPSYVCRTDEKGSFSMHNIEAGNYRIFALKDVNSNMKYDLPGELIAFSDSIIELTPGRFRDNVVVDTLPISDSMIFSNGNADTVILADTAEFSGYRISIREQGSRRQIPADSLKRNEKYYSYFTRLYFFLPEVKNQYLTNYLRPAKEKMVFTFNQPLEREAEIFPVNYTPADDTWYLRDKSRNSDTLTYWLTDTSMVAMDSLKLEVCYPVYDSAGVLYDKTDTLLLASKLEKSGRMRRGRKEEDSKVDEVARKILMLENNLRNARAFDLNKDVVVSGTRPLQNVAIERLKLFKLQDTLEIPVKISAERDTSSFYSVVVRYKPESSTAYKLLIPDSTFFDIYGAVNDTTILSFRTQSDDYYGALTIHLEGVTGPLIMQLLNEKEVLLEERKIFSDEDIRFNFLHPAKYILKIVYDTNGNGKWDTGNYLQQIQPEKVIYFRQIIDVRSNWEMDFTWDLGTGN